MKIIILDGYTVNPGDLSWDWLEEYGEYKVYDRTNKEDILSRCNGADIVITNKTPLDPYHLQNFLSKRGSCYKQACRQQR